MHIRCPHCQNPIEVVGNEEFASVNCPSCGSTFELVSQTLPHDPALHAQLLTPTKHTIAHFELVEQLGAGGFGTVWKARDTKLDRMVAVKVPRIDAHDREHSDMFLREARAAAQLRHPDIVAVHEVGRENGSLYIVSDFIEGVTLANRITASPLPALDAAQLLSTVAEALQHAHDAGVIHRDLKPQNIMLDGDGRPKLMDFGLAKREAGEVTMTIDGKILGTPAYMSPEQARGESHRVDRRTDIYSLGVILFELLTGERPFRGNQRMLLHQVVHDDPPSPRTLNSRVPRDLETICLKCLEKSPQKRFSTSQELADELHRYLSGQPILARPISRFEHALRWAQNNPVIAGLTTAVVFALLGGTAASTWFAISANKAAAATTIKAQEAINNANRERAQRQRADDETQKARRHLYAAHMNLALAAWEDARVGLAMDLLNTHRPQPGQEDLRGFEWYYLDRLCHSAELELNSHLTNVMGVAWSPDGSRIATAGWDKSVKVWDAVTGLELFEIKEGVGLVMAVAFSPDGKWLAACSDNGIKVWDVTDRQERLTLKGHTDAVSSIAFSPDGQRLASASWDKSARVWDANAGQELLILKGHTSQVRGVSFSPDGKRLATASNDRTIKVWDANTGQETLTLKGHSDLVATVAFSPDGKRLASGSWDRTAKVWDANSGQLLFTVIKHADRVNSVAFSPDSRRLASVSDDQTVLVLDLMTRREVNALRGHTALINGVAFSPDGQRLASAAFNGVKVWNAFRVLESETQKRHTRGISTIAFSLDGKILASAGADQIVKVFEMGSSQDKHVLKGHEKVVNCVAFSSDGIRLASASSDQTVKIWDIIKGEESFTLRGHTNWVKSVAFSSDGKRLASASHDESVKLWDVASGQLMQTLNGHTKGAECVAFSPDDHILAAGCWDGAIKLWNTISGQEPQTLKAHTQSVDSVTFSRDGKRLASCGLDRTIVLWDVATGTVLKTLKGHDGRVTSVAFNKDASRLASAGSDKTVLIWDVASGQVTLALKGHATFVAGVAFSPNGQWLASASNDGVMKLWEGTPRPAEELP